LGLSIRGSTGRKQTYTRFCDLARFFFASVSTSAIVTCVSTFGVVAIALLAGIFLCLLIAGIAAVLWAAWKAKKAADTNVVVIQGVQAKTEAELADQAKKLAEILEAAKSNFSGIRSEMRQSLEMYAKMTQETLEAHQKSMDAAVSKVNAELLAKAAKDAIVACREFQRIAAVMQSLLLNQGGIGEPDEEEVQPGKPWPAERAEEYAAPGQSATIYDNQTYPAAVKVPAVEDDYPI